MVTVNNLVDLLGLNPTKATHLKKRLDQAQGDPDAVDAIMDEVSDMIDGYGVEALTGEEYCDRYYGNIIALYINVGDTYSPTLLYSTDLEEFFVVSWGDFLEKMEQEKSGRQRGN